MIDEREEKGEAVSQKLRVAAESGLMKAREAIHRYMKETDRLYKSVDLAAQASQAGVRELSAKAKGFAEANISSTFEFALKLVHAQDPRDVLVLQQEFLKNQLEALSSQFKELGTTVVQATATLREEHEMKARQEQPEQREKQKREGPD